MLKLAERPLVPAAGCAPLADAVHDQVAFADLNRLAEEWVLPVSPTIAELFDATHPNFGGYGDPRRRP